MYEGKQTQKSDLWFPRGRGGKDWELYIYIYIYIYISVQFSRSVVSDSFPISLSERERERWGNSGNSGRLYLGGGSKITADGDYSHEIKRCLEGKL